MPGVRAGGCLGRVKLGSSVGHPAEVLSGVRGSGGSSGLAILMMGAVEKGTQEWHPTVSGQGGRSEKQLSQS